MKAAPWVLAGILAIALLAAVGLRRGPPEGPRVQELRTELLAARAEAQGWRQTLVEARQGLEAQLQSSRDSVGLLRGEKAALAREVEALGGRIVVLADMYAEVRGQLEAGATVHGTTPDSVTAPVDDGLLSGRVAYFPTRSTFALDYVARLALVLGVVDAPDGRAMLVARSPDPRVALQYGSVFYQPPEPIRVCTVGQRLEWGAWGTGLGFVGGLVTGLKAGGR